MEKENLQQTKTTLKLNISQLENIINGYNSIHSLQLIIHSAGFKYLPENISNDLYHNFLKSVIKHTLGFRLSEAIQDYTSQWQIKNSLEIKQHYMKLQYAGYCHHDNQFQILIILAVKTVMAFLRNRFSYIFFSRKFEHQVFISIINIILGIKVGGGTYQSMIEKHTIKGERATKGNSTNAWILKNILNDNLPKKRTKASRILRRKQTKRLNSPSESQKSEQNSTFIDNKFKSFHLFVKDCLYIKKNSQKNTTKPTIKQFYDHYPKCNQLSQLCKMQTYDRTMKKKQGIYTHQISDALKVDIQKQNINIGKSVKIKCKPLVSSSFYQIPKIKNYKLNSLHGISTVGKQDINTLLGDKKDIDHWYTIKQQMKIVSKKWKKQLRSNKVVFTLNNKKIDGEDSRVKLQPVALKKKKRLFFDSEKELPPIKQNVQNSSQNVNYQEEEEPTQKIKLNILTIKKEQQFFLQQCAERNKQVQESLFASIKS